MSVCLFVPLRVSVDFAQTVSPNTVNPKQEELESRNFESMFIVHYVSYVMCHVSHFTCHVSLITCHIFFLIKKISLKKLDKGVELVGGGLLSTGPTLSSLYVCCMSPPMKFITSRSCGNLWSKNVFHILACYDKI